MFKRTVLFVFTVLSMNLFAGLGEIEKKFPEGYQGDIRLETQKMFNEAVKNPKSPLYQALFKIYKENVAGDWALPVFPDSFKDVKLEKAIMLDQGNSSVEFGNSHIYPLHAATGTKVDSLIGWVKFSIFGEIFGEKTATISIIESNL